MRLWGIKCGYNHKEGKILLMPRWQAETFYPFRKAGPAERLANAARRERPARPVATRKTICPICGARRP